MLPSLHRYPIGLEYEDTIGREKIIGYFSSYFYYYATCYLVWSYDYNRETSIPERWLDNIATVVT